MKTKILSGLIGCLGIFSVNAQKITDPVGQSLTVTNPIDVTVAGGSVNVPADGSYNLGSIKVLSIKGTNNLFIGPNAGTANTAPNNLFIGGAAGQNNTTGTSNLFFGSYSGNLNSIGFANTFIGISAGEQNTTGDNNMFVGNGAGVANTTGRANVFLGANAGRLNGAGNYNTFIGDAAGANSANSIGNIFIGTSAGYNNTSGGSNSAIGVTAGYSNTTGTNNVFIGKDAGFTLTTGSSNTFLGAFTNVSAGSAGTLVNSTAVGANVVLSAPNTVVLGNAATTITGAGLGAGSGLRFANLTSASTAGTGGANKVLSVDATGNVILVGLTGGAGTSSVGGQVAENWKESDGYLYNNSTNGVVIKGSGLDGNALIVKGGVLSKEVNVKVEGSEAWPDYVFKPNYKRMTLGEVEKFIAINGHLPNVPSATEMVANGNNLGKTDVKLLEKVEELTLYLLEMKKVNDVQAAALKSLKQQVSKLRKK